MTGQLTGPFYELDAEGLERSDKECLLASIGEQLDAWGISTEKLFQLVKADGIEPRHCRQLVRMEKGARKICEGVGTITKAMIKDLEGDGDDDERSGPPIRR